MNVNADRARTKRGREALVRQASKVTVGKCREVAVAPYNGRNASCEATFEKDMRATRGIDIKRLDSMPGEEDRSGGPGGRVFPLRRAPLSAIVVASRGPNHGWSIASYGYIIFGVMRNLFMSTYTSASSQGAILSLQGRAFVIKDCLAGHRDGALSAKTRSHFVISISMSINPIARPLLIL